MAADLNSLQEGGEKMSARSRDGQGRWRSKTIGVRISPEENAELNTLVALSGMTKQEYCINRMLQRDIVVGWE